MILVSLPLLFVQGSEPWPSSPHDRVFELEISEHDEPAIGGHGPTVVAEYAIEFEGALHIWTKSDLDLFLRVDDASEARPLASDDNSGGGTTPYLLLEVKPGDWLVVLVAGEPGATGSLTLNLLAAERTELGRAAEKAAREALTELTRLEANGELDAARKLISTVMKKVRDCVESHPDTLRALDGLAMAMERLGDLASAHALKLSILAAREHSLPEDHPELLFTRERLAILISTMGDLDGALAIQESVLAGYERILPADHPYLLGTRLNLAGFLGKMGHFEEGRAIQESVVAHRERSLREDHPDVLHARSELANTMLQMRDFAGARTIFESVVAAYERSLPEDHPNLLRVRANLSTCMAGMGDLTGAHALELSVLEIRERSLPADHPDLLITRMNLAVSLFMKGDLAGARKLQERLLAVYEHSFPASHPDRLRNKENLASTMQEMGDFVGAHALFESVLEIYRQSRPSDHSDLLRAQANLAEALGRMGNPEGARVRFESVCAAYERGFPEGHPDLLRVQASLAHWMAEMGDHAGVRALRESILEAYERSLPEGHPYLLLARGNVAASIHAEGGFAEARALRESVVAAYERGLPEVHPDLLRARMSLALSAYALDDLAGIRPLLSDLAHGMRRRVLASLALAPRQARQVVASERERYSVVFFLSGLAGSEFEQTAFELSETMRLVAAEAAGSLARYEKDPELAPILSEASAIRGALNDLIAGATRENADPDEFASKLAEFSLRRDRLEREASRQLAERGIVAGPVELKPLVSALGFGDAAVGYQRIRVWQEDDVTGYREGVDHLFAQVVNSTGKLHRIDLGPATQLEELVIAWRTTMGAPGVRGLDLSGGMEDPEGYVGSELRARILDPVLALAGEDTTRLFVCADDLVFLLPLDALPIATKPASHGDTDGVGAERIGDRLRVVNEVSFARLLSPAPPIQTRPSLLAFGGVDYDADGVVPEGLSASSAAIEACEPAPEVSEGQVASRSALPDRFHGLPQARYEAEATAALFEEAFEAKPALLMRAKTTKAALFESAPGKRYLHLATHGWFAPESVRSTADPQPSGREGARMGIEERVTGLAPMTLCGLALAGANKGRDSLGRVPGILTAEELCSLDLSECELAVLSACETNVGIRRAGQGIQSLQSALYAAGARTSITSLWKVDDAATRRLMELFYTNLWTLKLGKAEALWQAKQALRDEGHPPVHWAGWVLTGDPE